MTKQICAHWFLQRKADEIVKRLAPDSVITPEVCLRSEQAVSDTVCPEVSKASWEVRFNLLDDANVDALVPVLNQAMLQLHERYDLDPFASAYVAAAVPRRRPVRSDAIAKPALPHQVSVAEGLPKRIQRTVKSCVAEACQSGFERARSRPRQRQPFTRSLTFAACDAPAGWVRFGFHRHRPILSAVI
jgi:hypothetical protein